MRSGASRGPRRARRDDGEKPCDEGTRERDDEGGFVSEGVEQGKPEAECRHQGIQQGRDRQGAADETGGPQNSSPASRWMSAPMDWSFFSIVSYPLSI